MARQPIGRSVLKKAVSLLKKVETAEELRQLQAVILPVEHGFSLMQTATILGITPSWVNKLRTQFIKAGGKLTTSKPKRGGRRKEKLSQDEESIFLAPFFEQARNGGDLVVKHIKQALDERLGRVTSLATVYNLLHRNGWHKVSSGHKSAAGSTLDDVDDCDEGLRQSQMAGKNEVNKTIAPEKSSCFLWGHFPYARQVNIINVDSSIANFALAKVEKFYKNRGFTINYEPELAGKMPTFVSIIFESSRHKVQQYEGQPNIIIGGTGWDVKSRLPDDIEVVKPRINLGYTSRGCNRSCSFCVVPVKEGKAAPEADLYDLWDGKANKVILLDNNLLQLQEHFRLVCEQAQKQKLILDFNQGLDIRLLNDDVLKILEKTRLEDIRFALDSPALIQMFRKKLQLLRRYKLRKDPLVYALCGFETSWEEDLERILFLKGLGCRPYVMKHANVAGVQKYTVLQEWVNQFWTLHKYTFDEFAKLRKERPDKMRKGVKAAEKG